MEENEKMRRAFGRLYGPKEGALGNGVRVFLRTDMHCVVISSLELKHSIIEGDLKTQEVSNS